MGEKIVDTSERCPEVEKEVWGEAVGVSQDILLGHVGCGAVEVEPAAADLKAVHGSQTSWRKGVDRVVGEACEE